jgi:hypothetical protein
MNGREQKCTQDFDGKTKTKEPAWKYEKAQMEEQHYDES